jgi:hypothetical protein
MSPLRQPCLSLFVRHSQVDPVPSWSHVSAVVFPSLSLVGTWGPTVILTAFPQSSERLLCSSHRPPVLIPALCRDKELPTSHLRLPPATRCLNPPFWSTPPASARWPPAAAAARRRCTTAEPPPLVSYRAKSLCSTFRCCDATLTPSSVCKT